MVSPEPSNSDTISAQLLPCFHVLHPNLRHNTDRRIADSYQITYRMNVQDHRRDEVSGGEGQTMVLCVFCITSMKQNILISCLATKHMPDMHL